MVFYCGSLSRLRHLQPGLPASTLSLPKSILHTTAKVVLYHCHRPLPTLQWLVFVLKTERKLPTWPRVIQLRSLLWPRSLSPWSPHSANLVSSSSLRATFILPLLVQSGLGDHPIYSIPAPRVLFIITPFPITVLTS